MKIGTLPPSLEELAVKHEIESDVVALDALMAHQYYIRECGLSRDAAEYSTFFHLKTTYEMNDRLKK